MVFVVSPMHMDDLAMDRKETRCYVATEFWWLKWNTGPEIGKSLPTTTTTTSTTRT